MKQKVINQMLKIKQLKEEIRFLQENLEREERKLARQMLFNTDLTKANALSIY
jgi:cell division protein ZapA (FtsZ GTPase activity inhibitor)